ncbi:hypothetical protein BAR24066_06936 [Burkholderia arboris]|uniref:Uncharacterized protein n=1 Tax=Burkholderia arboris TaxID=488730 RepID=A0A9Q9UUP0_9BURK|nr:hypothetical protein BAR24066_06936 [Burkholderia arboris]
MLSTSLEELHIILAGIRDCSANPGAIVNHFD